MIDQLNFDMILHYKVLDFHSQNSDIYVQSDNRYTENYQLMSIFLAHKKSYSLHLGIYNQPHMLCMNQHLLQSMYLLEYILP